MLRPSNRMSPRFGRVEAAEAVEQRRLAGAVRADQAEHLAARAIANETPSSATMPPNRTRRRAPRRAARPTRSAQRPGRPRRLWRRRTRTRPVEHRRHRSRGGPRRRLALVLIGAHSAFPLSCFIRSPCSARPQRPPRSASTLRTMLTSRGPMSLSSRSRVNWKAGAPQLNANTPEPSGAISGTPTALMSRSHSPSDSVKPRARHSLIARSMRGAHLRPVLAFLPLHVAEQPVPLGLGQPGDQRAAHRGGGDRHARARGRGAASRRAWLRQCST